MGWITNEDKTGIFIVDKMSHYCPHADKCSGHPTKCDDCGKNQNRGAHVCSVRDSRTPCPECERKEWIHPCHHDWPGDHNFGLFKTDYYSNGYRDFGRGW